MFDTENTFVKLNSKTGCESLNKEFKPFLFPSEHLADDELLEHKPLKELKLVLIEPGCV